MTNEPNSTPETGGTLGGYWGVIERSPKTLTILTAISVLVLLFILQSVLVPFLISCILAALTWPVRERILKVTDGRRSFAAGILVFSMILLIAIPIGAILAIAISQSRDLLAELSTNQVMGWLQTLQIRLGNAPILHELGIKPAAFAVKAQDALNELATWSLNQLFQMGGSLFRAVALSGIALMSLFYLYLSGDQMVAKLRTRIPLPPHQVNELLLAFRRTSRAIFKGNFVIGAIQGTITGLLFWGAGLPSPAFFGVVAAFCSLIPAVGTGLVWAPAGIILLISGEVGRALLVLGVGVGVISLLDNILRPVLVGRDAGMHDLMVFLTTIGGISFFGPVGVLFGPLVGAGVMAMLRLQEMEKDQVEPGPSVDH